MKNKEQFIDDAMLSIEGLGRAKPAPYLLTRVHTKLSIVHSSTWERLVVYFNRPIVITISLCFIILFNFSAIIIHHTFSRELVNKFNNTGVADQEDVSVANFYDIENTTP